MVRAQLGELLHRYPKDSGVFSFSSKYNYLTVREESMILETKRLFLREMVHEDFDALYKILADSDIMQHYPHAFDENQVRGWISRNIERYRIFGFGLWAV